MFSKTPLFAEPVEGHPDLVLLSRGVRADGEALVVAGKRVKLTEGIFRKVDKSESTRSFSVLNPATFEIEEVYLTEVEWTKIEPEAAPSRI